MCRGFEDDAGGRFSMLAKPHVPIEGPLRVLAEIVVGVDFSRPGGATTAALGRPRVRQRSVGSTIPLRAIVSPRRNMEVKMKSLKPVTPQEARAVWSSIPNPSVRRVASALTQAGRRVHPSTIARWHAAGWRSVARATELFGV
jgi:hypothetical protein